MIDDPDIWRATNLLVKRHGADAAFSASRSFRGTLMSVGGLVSMGLASSSQRAAKASNFSRVPGMSKVLASVRRIVACVRSRAVRLISVPLTHIEDGGSGHPVFKLLRHLEISNRQFGKLFAEVFGVRPRCRYLACDPTHHRNVCLPQCLPAVLATG